MNLVSKGNLCPLFHSVKDILEVVIYLVNGIRHRRMERHRNHRLHLGKINVNDTVIIGAALRLKLPVRFFSSMKSKPLLRLLIRLPDGGQAGGLCGHDVDSDTEILRKVMNALTDKLQNLVLDKPALENRSDQCDVHVMRAHTPFGGSCQMNGNDLGPFDVIGLSQKLLHKLRTTLTHCHCAQCSISCMRIGAENHAACCRHHFSCILVNDCKMRRNINTAVFLRGSKTEHVIIFIDRSSHRAQRIVAVRQHIGDRKSGESRCPCRLNDSDIGNVMACNLIKPDVQLLRIPGLIVRRKNAPGHGPVTSRFPALLNSFRCKSSCCRLIVRHPLSVSEIVSSVFMYCHHSLCLLFP